MGVRAAFAFPLHIGRIRLGALGVYRDVPGELDSDQMKDALAHAEAATRLLLHLQEGAASDGLNPHVAAAFTNHREIHQATGMISVQAGLGLAEALLLLRAHAYATGRPVRDVAREVTDRVLRFDPPSDPGGDGRD
jgi:hypothetical protein